MFGLNANMMMGTAGLALGASFISEIIDMGIWEKGLSFS